MRCSGTYYSWIIKLLLYEDNVKMNRMTGRPKHSVRLFVIHLSEGGYLFSTCAQYRIFS